MNGGSDPNHNGDPGLVHLTTDYLVIGAGVSGLAFVDELYHRTGAASFVVVDRLAHPGGHWNHAYSFVNLHQGSYFYGVNSERLERKRGTVDLSSKCEILAYYQRVMRKLLATGRVTFLSQCEYTGDGNARSLVASRERRYKIDATRKIVDGRYTGVTVPSTHVPSFTWSAGVAKVVPVNGLTELSEAYDEYVVIGNGKTGVDAILYLLDQGVGVDGSRIRWIVSRDAWYYNREYFGPESIVDLEVLVFEAIANERDTPQAIKKLHSEGVLLKFDDVEDPPVFRCASVTKEELGRVQRIGKIIRSGRVRDIDGEAITFVDGGSVPTGPNVLHVDCTACGLPRRECVPTFKDERNIVLQPVIPCSPAWSAAIVAMLEAKESDITVQNSMSRPVPHPETPDEWIAAFLVMMRNFDALAPHQRDLDGMRLNPLIAGRFLPRTWKLLTRLLPMKSAVLERAAERGL